MRTSRITFPLVVLPLLGVFACGDGTVTTTAPDAALFAKKDCVAEPTHPGCKDDDDASNDGTTYETAYVTVGDWEGGRDLTDLALTEDECVGTVVGKNNMAVSYEEPSDCDVVLELVTLTDDLILWGGKSKGELKLTFQGQDDAGSAGIMHESDAFSLANATRGADGVLHVHAANVPVWELSGHLRGGRIRQVGTISIGDIVYRAP